MMKKNENVKSEDVRNFYLFPTSTKEAAASEEKKKSTLFRIGNEVLHFIVRLLFS